MKKSKDWFELLREPLRSILLERAENLDEPNRDLAMAVLGAFDWETQPEGLSYWGRVYDALCAGIDPPNHRSFK